MATTKKILKCKYKKHWKHYQIKELKVDDLWASVPSVSTAPGLSPTFKKDLLEDISKNGLHFPLMVVHTSHKDLLDLKLVWGDKICNLPFWHNDRNPQSKYQWSICGGSQRLDVAKYLKYTHIDCAILPSVKKAMSHQVDMRLPYSEKYYGGAADKKS